VSDLQIIGRHILTVVRGPIILQASIVFGIAIAVQVGLDFLGFGDQIVPTWGSMLNDGGATDALAKTDFQVLVGSAGFGAQNRSRLADAMIDRAMDGLILLAPSMSRSRVIAVARTIPTVVVGHHDTADEYDSVVDDDRAGAALVVDHLVALGHRRIAHTSAAAQGQWKGRPEHVRSEGYRQAMHRHGLDDIAALGVLQAAYELGLRIPADLSLAGYDNTTLAASAPISLTSVDQAARGLGTTAARLLGERMDGRRRSVLSSAAPRLVIRNTTGAPPN
jgi:LacI family transcriptional regulator